MYINTHESRYMTIDGCIIKSRIVSELTFQVMMILVSSYSSWNDDIGQVHHWPRARIPNGKVRLCWNATTIVFLRTWTNWIFLSSYTYVLGIFYRWNWNVIFSDTYIYIEILIRVARSFHADSLPPRWRLSFPKITYTSCSPPCEYTRSQKYQLPNHVIYECYYVDRLLAMLDFL